jgi:hypothetical protein
VVGDDGIILIQVEAAVVERAWGKVYDEDRFHNAIRAGMKGTDGTEWCGVL